VPVKSEKQRRFMYASLAGKTDVPPSVAKKFVGPKAHAEGGTVKKESPAMVKKELSFLKKKGAPKSMIAHEKAEAKGKGKGKAYAGGGVTRADGVVIHGHTKGKMVKMMGGGKC
jgi:hypothetical protein